MLFSFILLAFLAFGEPGQLPSAPATTLNKQIEAILRTQDSREANARVLKGALRSPESRLRYQGLLAYASIQDTTVLPRILPLLGDPDSSVREAAALAVGQTGMLLSPSGRTRLLTDLRPRLESGDHAPRLIEELGKVVTQEDLDTLIAICRKQRGSPRLEAIHAVSRAAVRGVVSESATRFVLSAMSGDKTPWQAVYALQRIGRRQETNSALPGLVRLTGHPDPFVRMNLASLFGKLADSVQTEAPLRRMAFQDSDWRVRVNALRALSAYEANTAILNGLLQAIRDPNTHVASTATIALGNIHFPAEHSASPGSTDTSSSVAATDSATFASTVKRFLSSILTDPQMRWQVRAEAALAYARQAGDEARATIISVEPANVWMHARHIQALGVCGSLQDIDRLAATALSEPPLVACAILDALQSILHRYPSNKATQDKVFACALQALQSPDMAVRTTAASLLSDTLLARPEALEPLIAAGRKVKLPEDIEALQQIIAALGAVKDPRALAFLRIQLASAFPGIGEPAAKAVAAITGTEPPVPHPKPPESHQDLGTLRSLPDTVHIRMTTSQGTILCELYPRMAPFTVVSFVKLARNGFYGGLVFHRVVPNFVVQGGDPRGDGWGGPGYAIRSEFSPLVFETGSIGMASAGKDTEGSQFFITHSPQPHLDGRYTVFGKVVKGMDVVDKLQIGDTIKEVREF